MRSRGGIVSAALAAQQPVTLFLSGPAGGRDRRRRSPPSARACATSSRSTWAAPATTSRWSATARRCSPARARSAPIPVRTPMVDVNTIGAGGGSIAWIDAAGGLRVGPRSAGAEPGPACYGRGGDEATVTDASVVLGYLNPARFAGGTLALDAAAAERAVAAVGRRLGVDAVDRRRRHPPRGERAHGRPDPPGHDQARLRSAAVLAGGAGRRRSRARRGARRRDGHGRGAGARGAGRPRRLRPAGRRHRAPPRAHAAGAHRRGRPRRRQPLPGRARRRRARTDARGGRAGRPRCAWRTPPTCATSGRRTSWRCRSRCRSRASGCRRSWPRSTPSTSASTATRARSSRWSS